MMMSPLLALALLLLAGAANPGERPNVLFLLSDDQRPDAIGALGNPHVKTPHLDRLVREGLAFERAYCMGSTGDAVCFPSRAMLLSGRSLYRSRSPLVPRPSLLPELFRAAGYETFFTGKWHNWREWFQRCFTGGDAIFFGAMGSHTELRVQRYDPRGIYPERASYVIPSFSSTTFADAAIGFLERHSGDRPFFLLVAFTAPHDPHTPPPEYAALYDPDDLPLPPNHLPRHPFDNGDMQARDELLAPWPRRPELVRRYLADYYGLISHMDHEIGRILATLEVRGFSESTLVVFASDHGLAVGSHGLIGKQNLYEHSMGLPLVLRGPGIPAGERSRALAYLHDLHPTLCELAGIEPPAGGDGRSLAPILRGEAEAGRTSIFTAYRDVQRAVNDGRWKLICYPRVGRVQLFDLASDPHETRDLGRDPERDAERRRLFALLRAHQAEAQDELDLSALRAAIEGDAAGEDASGERGQ